MFEANSTYNSTPGPSPDSWGVVAAPEVKHTVKGKSWLVSGNRIVGLVDPKFKIPKGSSDVLVKARKNDQYPTISNDPETDRQLIVEQSTAERVLYNAGLIQGKNVRGSKSGK